MPLFHAAFSERRPAPPSARYRGWGSGCRAFIAVVTGDRVCRFAVSSRIRMLVSLTMRRVAGASIWSTILDRLIVSMVCVLRWWTVITSATRPRLSSGLAAAMTVGRVAGSTCCLRRALAASAWSSSSAPGALRPLGSVSSLPGRMAAADDPETAAARRDHRLLRVSGRAAGDRFPGRSFRLAERIVAGAGPGGVGRPHLRSGQEASGRAPGCAAEVDQCERRCEPGSAGLGDESGQRHRRRVGTLGATCTPAGVRCRASDREQPESGRWVLRSARRHDCALGAFRDSNTPA